MRTKPIYRHRITDNVYIVYKLSNYSRYPIREIEAGLAFTNNQYSSAFKKAKKKYGLSERGVWTTADSYKDFCVRLYLKSLMSSNKLPSKVADFCKHFWNIRQEEIKKELKNEKNE